MKLHDATSKKSAVWIVTARSVWSANGMASPLRGIVNEYNEMLKTV